MTDCQEKWGGFLQKMELKLHVYDGRKIVKTYTTDVFDIELGTLEEIIHALKLENMQSGDLSEIMGAVIRCVDVIRPFLMDMFPGLTQEEVRHTRTRNVGEVIQGIFAWFTLSMREAIAENKKKLNQQEKS